MLGDIDYYLRDSSRGFARIQNGEVPDGSGNPIPIGGGTTLDDYLFLPGRPNGQVSHAVDSNPGVTFTSLTSGLTTAGSIGNPIVRFSYGATPVALMDIRPYLFGTGPDVIEAIFTGGATPAAGAPISFLSDDGTSAFRIASTANRTFLQCGLKSGGNVINANMTIGGAGTRVARHVGWETQYMRLSNTGTQLYDGTVVAAGITRFGIGVDPIDYSGVSGTWTDTVVVKPLSTAGAAVAVELTSYAAANPGFALRGASSTGGGDVSPNSDLGQYLATIESDGLSRARVMLWDGTSPGARVGGLGATGANAWLISSSNQFILSGAVANEFSDSVSTTVGYVGDILSTHRYSILTSGGANKFERLGIAATAVILGNTTPGLLRAPGTHGGVTDLLTVCDTGSPALLLSGLTSTGAYFLVSGGAAGNLFVSDANGVGSWSATLSTDITFADTKNLILNTGTGSKIATGATQKLGFWNATPIVQPTTAGAAATRVGGGGTGLTDTDTFDGYTVAQVVKALRNTGLLA